MEVFLVLLSCFTVISDAARILFMVPTPSFSHQVVFRPLITELVKRGHEVVSITTDPMFKDGERPANLTEIDVHDISYDTWRNGFLKSKVTSGNKGDSKDQMSVMANLIIEILEKQLLVDDVHKILTDKTQKFDLLFFEAYFSGLLGISHLLKAPVIQMSTIGPLGQTVKYIGASYHPLLYPSYFAQKVNNRSLWDKISELYYEYYIDDHFTELNELAHEKFQNIFGADIPPLKELRNNVDMVFLNVHPIWDFSRPVPPNVIYMRGLHQKEEKDLPQDLKSYLDSSKHGVIYISFGTNVDPSMLPAEKIQAMINALSKLPYDVLWKWNQDVLPGRTSNIRISKWLPQSDLLRHPKIKLFITQGGLQSTDEAINAGVPLIGMPMLADQWFNVEVYEHHKIGLGINFDTLTEDKLRSAIETIVNDNTYRLNVLRLRQIMHDQPQSPLERAVWWTEHVIRHSGARHLRAAGANIPWHQYYELELVTYVLLALTIVILSIILACYYVFTRVHGQYRTSIKVKSS